MRSSVAVVGGGISGLATAYRLMTEEGLDVRLFEAESRTGGTIRTLSRDGYQVESGPNGFLDSRLETVDLVEQVGLADEQRPANPASSRRFTVRDGKLVELASSPVGFIRSPVLRPMSRLRVMLEGLIPRRAASDDETVYDFAKRRLGAEFAERLIDPMVAGIYAGDPRLLSLKSTFPRMAELESEHGSLTRALVRLMRQRRREGKQGPNPSGFGGRLTTFQGGMQALTDRLTELLGSIVTTDRRLVGLEQRGKAWSLTFEDADGTPYDESADAVVLALPAYASASALDATVPELSSILDRIPYAPIAVVALGFDRNEVDHPLDGFGFVSPYIEKLPILGTIWTSSIFPQNSPTGRVLLRTMVGGSRDPESIKLDDDELVDIVCGQLDSLMGVRGAPVFKQIFRWHRGIPQYTVGHGALLEQIDAILQDHPGLFLAGNAYRGISINDCVREAAPLAERIRHLLRD